jgi:hypothetical protein
MENEKRRGSSRGERGGSKEKGKKYFELLKCRN